jgi:hypothetical protein
MTAYLRIDVNSTCVQQLERCAEHVTACGSDPDRLIDAIRCAHLAALAAMIGALVGSAGVGAFPEKLASKHLKYLRERDDQPDLPYPEERTLSFAEALIAVQEPGRLEYGGPVVLTKSESVLARELDFYRQLIDHPKPTSWSVPVEDIRDAVRFAPLIIKRLRPANHHLFDFADRIEAASSIVAAA